MKTKIAVVALWFASGFFVHWLVALGFQPPVPAPVPTPVGNAEVSDLVARLAPFAEDPSSEYYGVSVTYSGGGVSIRMRLKNRNEYNARSKTLAGAVEMLTTPSDAIKSALIGWKK